MLPQPHFRFYFLPSSLTLVLLLYSNFFFLRKRGEEPYRTNREQAKAEPYNSGKTGMAKLLEREPQTYPRTYPRHTTRLLCLPYRLNAALYIPKFICDSCDAGAFSFPRRCSKGNAMRLRDMLAEIFILAALLLAIYLLTLIAFGFH
jgi:hypothetical protein